MRPAVERSIETLPAVFAVGTLAVVALLAVLGFGNLVSVAAVVGWLLLTPLSALLVYVFDVTGDEKSVDDLSESVGAGVSAAGSEIASEATPNDSPDDDPLATLRDRYARGEIDEVEFERRLERLLETEDIELPPGTTLDSDVVEDSTDAADTAVDGATDTEREPARER